MRNLTIGLVMMVSIEPWQVQRLPKNKMGDMHKMGDPQKCKGHMSKADEAVMKWHDEQASAKTK